MQGTPTQQETPLVTGPAAAVLAQEAQSATHSTNPQPQEKPGFMQQVKGYAKEIAGTTFGKEHEKAQGQAVRKLGVDTDEAKAAIRPGNIPPATAFNTANSAASPSETTPSTTTLTPTATTTTTSSAAPAAPAIAPVPSAESSETVPRASSETTPVATTTTSGKFIPETRKTETVPMTTTDEDVVRRNNP